uniref:MAT1-1 n=1 Tax=Aspergillus pseudoglaucus TaxID=1405805 RepID=A0A3G6VE23_ASPPE|nr:MAT1-1 [Aspergillus pseudoglaucus]
MEAELSPLQRAFNNFLLSMPPQQLEDLVKYIQNGKAQEVKSPVNEYDIPAARVENALDHQHGVALPDSAVTRPSSSRGKRSEKKRRRPLNRFIAFRSFYSPMFPDLTQKAKSGILRFLWQNDPFKAKWAILAKAYSIIRDKHDDEVSLESFLTLNAPLIGLLDPDRYLNVMGWQFAPDDQQQYTMARVKPTRVSEAESSRNYSVNDLVKHCYATGYVTEAFPKQKADACNFAPGMAFAVQPFLVRTANNSLQISGNAVIVSDIYKTSVAMEYCSIENTPQTHLPQPSEPQSTVACNFLLGNLERKGVHLRHQNNNDPGAFPQRDLDNMGFPRPGNQFDQRPMDPFDAFELRTYPDI